MWWLDPGKEVLNVLFNRILAPYVENLDLNQVNYGIGQGQLTLRSLRLKKGALDKFRLPIDVLEGHLGKFSLSLHWLNLGNQPVEVLIEDVYLLVVPSSHNEQDPGEEEERAQAIKRERLENAELLHLRGEAEKSGDQQPQGFWESLLAKVVNNLQISVKNIHIRYEDKYSVPHHPFVAGITLEGFTAVSVDDNWEPAFIESTAGAIHKLAKLQSLAVYFDTDVKKLESDKNKKESIFHANATEEVKEASAKSTATHQYILNPVSGEGRITINRRADPRTPRFDVQLFLDTIGVAVDDNQYRDTILLLDSYHVYMRKRQYRKYWPEDGDRNLAKTRLSFAGKAVLGSIQERRRKWTWPYFAERRDDRNRYIELFERKVVGNAPQNDIKEVEQLERKLTYEDIRFYRSIARSRLRKDDALRQRLQAEQAPPQPAKQSWSSWIWGSSEANKKQDNNAFNQPMTESQKKELYDVIDYDERNAIAESFEAPRDTVKALFSLQLNQGIFALKTNPHSSPQELTSISFQDFHASFLQRADNFEASMSLGDFSIQDGIMKNTIHKKIVSVKNKELTSASSESVEQDDEPFFYANFEKNPLDERADSALTVKLRRVQIVYHKGYVEAIYKFFQAPASHLESVEALLSAASETFEGFRKETRAGLEHALQTHRTIDVRMDLNAPVIIIPEDVTSSTCKHLIIDAGHISVESDLAKKDALKEIQMKRKKAYSEKDYKQLESLMYDRFSLKLASAQFVLGNDLNACLDALLPESKDNLHLLERINIDLQVHNSIVPSVVDLPRIRVAGKLPLLQLNFSDTKYKTLMRLVDVSIPKFGDDEVATRPSQTVADINSFQLSTGFFGNTGPEYTVADHDEQEGAADDDQETFFEAEDGEKEGPENRQHKFDLSFQVEELRASVSRSIAGGDENLLGDLILQRFALEFSLTEFGMAVDIDLRSLSLDLIQPSAKPLRFISSVEEQDGTIDDLMTVHYIRTQRKAPDFESKYDGFDQTVEVKLSTFIFTALPEPIISLYDFIMTTFAPSNNAAAIPSARADPEAIDDSHLVTQQASESKIRVLIELASVQVRLISGNEALATLCLSTANVSVFLSKTLRVIGRLGNIALTNDMHSQQTLPDFNNILSIEGEELAEFRYQTFDPEREDYNGIKSSVFLHTASFKLHFLAEPIRGILVFLSKLAKLKGLYDAATQAAVQTASNVDVGGMQFDVSIKTPILVYPRYPTQTRDVLVMQLGEINVKNSVLENETKTVGTLNGILLVSTTYFNGEPSSLKMIENIDIKADVIQNVSSSQPKDRTTQPDMQISVTISDVKLHLTQAQYTILLALASSISSVLVSAEAGASQYDPSEATLAPLPIRPEVKEQTPAPIPETTSTSAYSTLDLVVTVNAITLHLYDKHATTRERIKEHGIARFALVDNSLRFKALGDGSSEAQVILRSFTVANIRPGSTKFREIVPSAQHDRNQFMVLYTTAKSPDIASVAVVTIDAPQVIFAIDPLMALIEFFSTKDFPASSEPARQSPATLEAVEVPKNEQTPHLNFRLELHELSVSILENDSNPETHCIRLFVHHLLISQQAAITLSVERLGMSLTRLGKLPESVRFLDDVDLTLSLNNSTSTIQQFSSIEAVVKPVVFRASYGDIMLISSIVQRAIESYGQLGSGAQDSQSGAQVSARDIDKSATKATRTSGHAIVSLSKEQLTASFDGLRLVLIGDLYEQPLLHLKVNPFILGAKDWSGELHATTTMATQINYWNLLNSHWEPLIDPWTFTLTATRGGSPGGMNIGLSARDRLDLNISTTLIEFANTASSIWAKEGSQVLQKPRGTYAPYRLRNRTGSTFVVWADDEQSGLKDVNTVKVLDNQTVDWRFDGWRATREHVSSGGQHNLCLQFLDKEWEKLRGIPIDREGEFVFSMRPRSKYPSRLLVEVKVVDAVKIVTIRSTYQVENHTLYPVELMLVNDSGHPIHSLERIVPGESFPLPIDIASASRVRLQPDQGFGYKWCQAIRWEDLISKKSFTIKCPHAQPEEAAFRFQGFVQTDARELTSRAFPKIALKLRAPLELENLLPYNLEYRIYDKDTDQNWRSYLRQGGVMPVHSVELSHFVLLNVFLQDTVFNASEFAIINTDGHSDFDIESRLTVRDRRNRKLDLRLNYVRYPNSGGAFRVQIYSPVIFVNKTELPFFIKTTRSTRAGSQDVAGDDRPDVLAVPSPYLASHPYDNGHEYIVKVGDSAWSKTISLEAPTAETALVIPSEKQRGEEIHVGVSWSEGRGKYKLTKIVTLTPRFLLKNSLSEPISYREHGYPPRDRSTLQPGERHPLQFIKGGNERLITIAYPGLNSQWSAPINMEDIGPVYLRLKSPREGASDIPLVRGDVLVDTSTIFVTFTRASEWPFLVENKSDYPVTLSQTNSGQSNEPTKRSNPTYSIQPGADLEYAWDFPAAINKKILLTINGAPRVVDIMEIGNLVPFKFHNNRSSKAVSLDVRAAGQQQILRISNYHPDLSVYKPRNRNVQSMARQDTFSSTVEFEPISETVTPTLSLNLDMAGIGVSLMNRNMVEVVYASINALKLEYSSSPVAQSFNISCGTLQIDNQLHDALYPVLLQPTPINKESTGVAALPTVQGSVIWLNDQEHGVIFVKYCSILLQALTIECDEDLLFALIDLVKVNGLSWEDSDDSLLLEDIKVVPEPSHASGGEELYFEVLELQPIKLSLSFMRTERVSTEAKSSIRNPIAVALNAFTMAVGNINDAPLEMNALGLKDMHLTMPELSARISYHYRQEVLRQLYRLLGSADFIGNPVGLFTNVSSGVADIFYEPFHGNVMHGNKELGLGIAKGAASFVKKTVFGVSDSVTKFTSSVGKGLSAATFDPEYQARRRIAQRRNKPRHAIYGVAAGGEALASSVTSAVEGVLMKPLEGAEREGAVGFFKGIGKGFVGAVTKPVVGVFDLASNVSEGIRNTTTVFDSPERDRVRLPRHVSADGVLTPYSAREALGQYWMKDLNNGAYRQEAYVAHINSAGDEKVVLLTRLRVLSFWVKNLRLEWDLPFGDVHGITVEDTGIRFGHKAGKDQDRFAFIPDKASQSWFFAQLSTVVKAYNARKRMDA